MTAKEFLETEANPDDVIAITCDADWELNHLENLLEQYHQAKLKLLGIADVSDIVRAFEDWQKKYPLVNIEEPEWQLKRFLSEYYR